MIKTIVYTPELEKEDFILSQKKIGVRTIIAKDSRSAAYIATGIAGQAGHTVIICVPGNNASRSVFGGMTEAFYRQLPVVLITFGTELDYSVELPDVAIAHYRVRKSLEIESLLSEERPIHIEVIENVFQNMKISCSRLDHLLQKTISSEDYVFIGSGVSIEGCYRGKVVRGGMPGCYDGSIANVLGASLANKRRRYIGIVSQEELEHDVNTLGNKNINDLLLYIVICRSKNIMLLDYAESLGFAVYFYTCDKITEDNLKMIIGNQKKSILMIFGA